MRVVVLGASGMLGNTMLRVLSEKSDWEAFGTVREESVKRFFSATIGERIYAGIDAENQDALVNILDRIRPNVVVNCVGLTSHMANAEDPLVAIPINTLMPHRLAALCKLAGARLIHVSTDCVFSGEKGSYVEDDVTDARDVYGKSKALGEVRYPHTITLRTSFIGHELKSKRSLLEWFLSQQGRCKGYTRAVFSGLPSVVFAQVVRDLVIPHAELSGVYHVGARPIAKFDLLKTIADVYGKSIDIVPDDTLRIDRSLEVKRFQAATGYVAPEWRELIDSMHTYG